MISASTPRESATDEGNKGDTQLAAECWLAFARSDHHLRGFRSEYIQTASMPLKVNLGKEFEMSSDEAKCLLPM